MRETRSRLGRENHGSAASAARRSVRSRERAPCGSARRPSETRQNACHASLAFDRLTEHTCSVPRSCHSRVLTGSRIQMASHTSEDWGGGLLEARVHRARRSSWYAPPHTSYPSYTCMSGVCLRRAPTLPICPWQLATTRQAAVVCSPHLARCRPFPPFPHPCRPSHPRLCASDRVHASRSHRAFKTRSASPINPVQVAAERTSGCTLSALRWPRPTHAHNTVASRPTRACARACVQLDGPERKRSSPWRPLRVGTMVEHSTW